MKQLTLIFLIVVFSLDAQAQTPAPGSNQTNNFVNKFEGTWQWANGADTMILKLKKYNTQFPDYSQDVIMGVHRYIKNGLAVENAIPRFDSIAGNNKKRTILLSYIAGDDTAKVEGSIKDLTKKKLNRLTLQFVTGTPATLIWHLELREGTYNDPNFQFGLTMPEDIILTKQ